MKRKVGLRFKRAFDFLAAIILLAATSPLMIVVALAILATMGPPILFRQKRIGQNGREFTILKFRTMRDLWDERGARLPDEKRLSGVGRFLRSTTLDELPGLVNVVRGEMSIVGPRPLLVDYRHLYTPEQWRRHEMPPGMAGPVLADGRNLLPWEDKFARDIWYVDNWSLMLDLRILVRTALGVLRREGVSAEGYATMPRFTGSQAGPPEASSLKADSDPGWAATSRESGEDAGQ